MTVDVTVTPESSEDRKAPAVEVKAIAVDGKALAPLADPKAAGDSKTTNSKISGPAPR